MTGMVFDVTTVTRRNPRNRLTRVAPAWLNIYMKSLEQHLTTTEFFDCAHDAFEAFEADVRTLVERNLDGLNANNDPGTVAEWVEFFAPEGEFLDAFHDGEHPHSILMEVADEVEFLAS